jgi:hypothetical protein
MTDCVRYIWLAVLLVNILDGRMFGFTSATNIGNVYMQT